MYFMIYASFMKNSPLMKLRLKKSQAPAWPVPQAVHEKPFKMPDFAARARKIWKGRIFTEQEVREIEEFELEGQEG